MRQYFLNSVLRKLFMLVDEKDEEENSECSNSLYAAYDPFDYMYSPSECSQHSDPIYAAVVKTQTPLNSPPPLPPRNRIPTNEVYVSKYSLYYVTQIASGELAYASTRTSFLIIFLNLFYLRRY